MVKAVMSLLVVLVTLSACATEPPKPEEVTASLVPTPVIVYTPTPDVEETEESKEDTLPELLSVKILDINGKTEKIPLTHEQQTQLLEFLNAAEKLPEGYERGDGVYATGVYIETPDEEMMGAWIYNDGTVWIIGEGMCEAAELTEYLFALSLAHTGIDPLGYNPGKVRGLVSAELMLARKTPLVDPPEEPVSQLVTDSSELLEIEKLFQNAQSVQGLSACPFDMRLTLTRVDGTVIEYSLADDSCDSAVSKEGVCVDYNGRPQMEAIFSDIPWR